MKQAAVAAAVMAVAVSLSSGSPASAAGRSIRHCGSFKYGVDGKQPGPGGITAENVSCWFARAVALLGPPSGWRCKLTTGVLFVCRGGSGVVKFYGE